MIKFKPYQFVKVADEMPPHMSHFEKGFIGIIAGTYAELHQPVNPSAFKAYRVYQVDDGKIVNRISWYDEEQLSATAYAGDSQKMVYEYLTKRL